mmetsp:Transcript_9561/g.15340  ORF Transcript_9561/g.15340 Transcript_9561/m.15340 type:complete len:84 (-) Transcript_9561:65-316(-)
MLVSSFLFSGTCSVAGILKSFIHSIRRTCQCFALLLLIMSLHRKHNKITPAIIIPFPFLLYLSFHPFSYDSRSSYPLNTAPHH